MKTLPVRELCKGSEIRKIKLSPSGENICCIKKGEDGDSLYYLFPEGKEKRIENLWLENIIDYTWDDQEKYILLIDDPTHNGCWELYRYNIELKQCDQKICFLNTQIKLMGIRTIDNCAILSINYRKKAYFDIYKLNIETWEIQMIFQNDKYFRFVLNEKCEVILGCRMNQDGVCIVDNIQEEYTDILKIEPIDFFGTFPLCVTKDKKIILRDSRGRDKSIIAKVDLKGDNYEIVIENELVDVEETFFDSKKGDIVAVAFYYLEKKWICLDKNIKKDFEILTNYCEGEISILSRSKNGDKWIVEYIKSDCPNQYVLYDEIKKRVIQIEMAHGREYIESYVKKIPVIIKTDNQDAIICYLMKPQEQIKGLVVNLHGGPWERDTCKFIYFHQWLIGLGYMVLTVNYHGSKGFGKNFLNMDSGNWTEVLNNDIVMAVEQIVKRYGISKSKVAIVGNSFGGYLAQLGITERPDVFKCAVSIGGVSSLKNGLTSFPLYKGFQKEIFKKYLGHQDLERQSPLFNINHKTNAILLIHGENDPIASHTESLNIYEKLKVNNLYAKFLLFQGEGHAIKKMRNKRIMYYMMKKFLNENFQEQNERNWEENMIVIKDRTPSKNKILTSKVNGVTVKK